MVVNVDNRKRRLGNLRRLGDQHRARLPVAELQLLDVALILGEGELGSEQRHREEPFSRTAHDSPHFG